MAEHKDREPVFGKLDELDEETDIPSGLRVEAKREDSSGVPAPTDSNEPRAETGLDVEPAVSAAIGLTTRTRPSETELIPSGPGNPEPGNPGAAIRAARDRLGVEVSTLAFRTRLPQRVIENLEANRFESMAPTYVRGYLRAVARELDGDADRWIRAYESLGYTELAPRASVQRDLAGRRGSSGGRIWYWIAAAIVLSVLGLGIHAWTEGTPANPLSGLMAWFVDADRPSVSDDPPPGLEPPVPSIPEPAAEIDWVPEPEPFGIPSDALTLESEAESANGDLVVGDVDEEAAEATLANVPVPMDTLGAPDAGTVLSFSFEGTSWIEVRSPGDQIELRGIFHAGDRQMAMVELPARIVLGNAPAVRLEQGGMVVDLTSHTREDSTARFTLGAE